MNHKHQDYISSKINKPKITDDIFLAKCTSYFIKPKTFENQMICWEQDMSTRSIPLEWGKLRQFIEYLRLICSVAFNLLTIKQKYAKNMVHFKNQATKILLFPKFPLQASMTTANKFLFIKCPYTDHLFKTSLPRVYLSP